MNNTITFSLNYKQDMKENTIITRIKLLKPLLEKKTSQIDLANNLGV
jgi:Trp operon repressor